MEGKAREFIDRLIEDGVLAKELYGDNRNFKPWYSPRDLIDQTAKNGRVERVMIGVNPAGCPGEHDPTTQERRWEQPLNDTKPFNAYLDEGWKDANPGEAPLQCSVRKVFKALYDTMCEQELRKTISFNFCPARTHDASCIPPKLWTESVDWCLEVLKYLKPEHVICIGNGEGAKSPWAALKRNEAFDEESIKKWKRNGVWLKYGEFGTGRLAGTSVIGLRHLSYKRYVPTTIELLEQHRHEMKLPEAEKC